MIELDRVAKSYRGAVGRRILLDNVSAEFCSGHNFGILGANGAGKSTLIRLLAGSEMPDCGTIHRRVRVSFPLGFGGTVHGALSGRENVAFIARVYVAGVRRMARFVEGSRAGVKEVGRTPYRVADHKRQAKSAKLKIVARMERQISPVRFGAQSGIRAKR